jgi:hypothetical protein
MKNKKTICILLKSLALAVVISLFIPFPVFSYDWEKGTITGIGERSITIDGWTYFVSETAVFSAAGSEEFTADLTMLRGVEEVLYRLEDGKIKEIKIFRRKH